MALEFDVNAFLSINIGKSLDGIARSLVSAETQCLGQWTVLIASKADKPFSVLAQIVKRSGGNSSIAILWPACFHACNQAAKILVTDTFANDKGNMNRGF